MTPERNQHIQEAVAILLELDSAQRIAYLDEHYAGAESLRHEIESLLHEEIEIEKRMAAEGFLETPAPVKFAGLLAAEQASTVASDEPVIFNGRYVVERELERGGFGEIYLARDSNLHERQVVVKVLQAKVGQGSQQLSEYTKRKFRGEIDALTRFRHPHIVSILDQGSLPGGDPFFVMEYIEGASLRSAMRCERMEFARIAEIMQQTGQAISHAHDRGVLHRDLKPENIMLRSNEGSVVVIDFGVATVKEWSHVTRGGAKTFITGTPDYMAPEQIDGEPSTASDTWAQGVIAYEALTGRLPFAVPRDNRGRVRWQEFYEMQRAGAQINLKELRPDLPEAAQSLILKALSFNPKDRFTCAREFGDSLAAALTGNVTVSSSTAVDLSASVNVPRQVAAPTIAISGEQPAEVVITYCAQDHRLAHEVAGHLNDAGISCRMADHGFEIVCNDRTETIRAIRHCKVLLLLCSDAALRSGLVKQEMQCAWSYERPLLPLVIEPLDFQQQAAYWSEDQPVIEAHNAPSAQWLPHLLRALAQAGVHCPRANRVTLENAPVVQPIRLDQSLQSLRRIARFTDQIWPLPAARAPRNRVAAATRGLGAPQEDVGHGHRLGSRVCLAIESDRAGHLLLLDEGPEGIIYCLCPSWFAPDTHLPVGRIYLPQAGARYESFVVTGKPGREHLLAIISDDPLGLDWMPSNPKIPARVLSPADVDLLLTRLRQLEVGRWRALSTYFDVLA